VSEREVKIENEIGIGDMEEGIQGIMLEGGQQALGMGINSISMRRDSFPWVTRPAGIY